MVANSVDQNVYEEEKEEKKDVKEKDKKEEKRHTPNQEALNELAKDSSKQGISNEEADILLDWASEYDFPGRDDRGKPPHWVGGEHIHFGN
jgi:hypothetical protein